MSLLHDHPPHLTEFTATLVTAAVASFHCAGMCGPFALGASVGRKLVPTQLLYHLGKTVPYLALGGVAGVLGADITRPGSASGGALRWLALAAGLLLIGAGLHHLGLRLVPRKRTRIDAASLTVRDGSRHWTHWLSRFVAPLRGLAGGALAYNGPARPLVLGTLSGLLPCPLVYAFVAKAASTGSTGAALLTMAALGLGTAPILVVVAASGSAISPLVRQRVVQVSGVLLVLLGIYTWFRGFSPLPCCAG